MSVVNDLINDLSKVEQNRLRDGLKLEITCIAIHPQWFDTLAHECGRGELTMKEDYTLKFMGRPILRDPKVKKWEFVSFNPVPYWF